MTEKGRKWIDAAIQLGQNPDVKVICPECGKGFLGIKDEPIEELQKLDRYLICDNCGKWNVMTMSIPGS